ncbi:MAG: hypothetical protein D3914_12595, partial [Candidatus Electrothrix sp. LOE2]|nr:hypothetical protein [Candidatus Electrothrix sp. LOE2]
DEISEFSADGAGGFSDDEPADEESIAGDFDFDAEAGLDDDLFADETDDAEAGEQEFVLDDEVAEEETIVPALTDAEEDGGFNEELAASEIDDDKAAELDEKLDSFFDFNGPDEPPEQEEKEELAEETVEEVAAVAVEKSAGPVDVQPTAVEEDGESELGESDEELDSFFDFSDELDDDDGTKEEEKARVESWKDEILAADLDEPEGEEEGLLEGEEDYDSFFNFDSDEAEEEVLPDDRITAAADNENNDDGVPAAGDDEFSFSPDDLGDEQKHEEIAVALADADEEGGFNEGEMSSAIDDEKAAELDEKLNFFFELDKEDEEGVSGDQVSAPEEDDAVTAGPPTESGAFEAERSEAMLELDDDDSELSFNDDEDFDGDIAVFSLDTEDTDDTDDTEPVRASVGQGVDFASDADEEIEGLDAVFDLDDDAQGSPEFETSSADGPEEIPALEDEFVISLDDEDSTDELFDFSFDSGEEENRPVSSDVAEDVAAKDSLFSSEEDSDEDIAAGESGSLDKTTDDVGSEDEFALSLDEEKMSDDEFADFSFDSEDDESEASSEAEALDNFFELEEESGETSAAASSDEDEEIAFDDEASSDDEFSLLFDDDESAKEAVPSALNTSEKAEEAEKDVDPDEEFLSLDEEEFGEDADGFDGFLDLEEDLGESLASEESKDSPSLKEQAE